MASWVHSPTNGDVSRSPPIIPDGQISRVRFETSAFFRGPFQGREVETLGRIRPSVPGLPPASSPGQFGRHAGFIKPATPLTRKPPSVLSPFAQRWCYLHWGDVTSISSEGVTPRSSLVRAHVPLPLGPRLRRHSASFEESLQVV